MMLDTMDFCQISCGDPVPHLWNRVMVWEAEKGQSVRWLFSCREAIKINVQDHPLRSGAIIKHTLHMTWMRLNLRYELKCEFSECQSSSGKCHHHSYFYGKDLGESRRVDGKQRPPLLSHAAPARGTWPWLLSQEFAHVCSCGSRCEHLQLTTICAILGFVLGFI